nr:unnamed protein product [Callosobruchus analis]
MFQYIALGQIINLLFTRGQRQVVNKQVQRYLNISRPCCTKKTDENLFQTPRSDGLQRKYYMYAKKLLSTNQLQSQDGKSSNGCDKNISCRHQFHKDVEDGLNCQAMDEFSAAFAYLSMSCYFGRSDIALPGCQGYFMDMYEEELEHAIIFTNYILLRGGQVKLCCIEVPQEHDWKSITNAFNAALDLEKSVKEKLMSLCEKAEKHRDLHLLDIISSQFMEEQNESIRQLARLVVKAQMTDSKVGEHLFDQMIFSTFVKKSNMMYKKSIEGMKKENGKKFGGASLLLPKVRRNPLIEIIAINTGCLNQCTYCKTKHARGDLGSYPPEEIVARAKLAFEEGVVEIWLTSEDTGTYGRDIGTSLPELLWKLVKVIPEGCRLRLGMTNPPYILEHLEEIAKIMLHPKVYRFLHVPVQSGSDQVLADMKRQYCRSDFENVVDFLKKRVPGMTIATDIICGFPTETDQDFEDTMDLCKKYKFPSLFINQFFPRPGTPAALLPKVPTQEVKRRTKRLTDLFYTYLPYDNKVGEVQEVLATEVSHDKKHYVAHNESYEQVLIPMRKEYLGKLVKVKIIKTTKFSMVGQPLDEIKMPGLTKPLEKGQVSGIKLEGNMDRRVLIALIFLFFSIVIKLLWNKKLF